MGICALFAEGRSRKRPSAGFGDTGQAKAKDMREGHGGGQGGMVNTERIAGHGQTQAPKSAPCSGPGPASSCLGSLCWFLGSWAMGDGVTYTRLGNNSSGGKCPASGGGASLCKGIGDMEKRIHSRNGGVFGGRGALPPYHLSSQFQCEGGERVWCSPGEVTPYRYRGQSCGQRPDSSAISLAL